jgi:two-component system CheB/CheR fusion protein
MMSIALFTLRIPIATRVTDSPVNDGAVEQRSPKSVLLVEDNKDLADGLAELLRLQGGVQVRVAYDGPSAIKSALEAVPDIILCDLGLPGMDGFAIARACRAEVSLRKIRLVATSGYSSSEDHANAATAGFDALMTKPLTEELLRKLIR